MKSLWFSVLLIAGLLQVASAAEHNCTPATNRGTTYGSRLEVNGTSCSPAHSPAPVDLGHSKSATNRDDGTVVVDVWSSEEPPQKLSQGFASAGLMAASRMQNTERRMEQSIKRGFPLGEFWIRLDFDAIDDSLRQASLTVRNDADRTALQQLQGQTERLRAWSDWLIGQNRELRLANYYISPATLDNDEQFQGSVTCTNYLLSMLASGQVQEEDRSCR